MSINIKKQLSQYAIDKHIKPMVERDKQAKRQKLKTWFYNNWISLVGLAIAIIAFLKSYFY